MRRSISMISICCLTMALSACSQSQTGALVGSSGQEKETVKPKENIQKTSYPIVSEEPIVISETYIYDSSYQVQLVMTKGYYSNPGLSSYPNAWHGDFSLRVLESGEVVSEKKIDFEDGMGLAFPYSFQLHMNDMNGDKSVDVAIGQYLSSGKIECKLYSIDKKGVISSLDIEGEKVLYVAGNDISPEFQVTEDGKVKYQSFATDSDESNEVIDSYLVWDNNKFTKQ